MSAKKKLDGIFSEIPCSYASDSHSLPKDQSILEYSEQTSSEGGRVGKCSSRNRLRQTAAVRRRRGRRFGRGRLKNRNRVRAYRTHPTSGLKVLSVLRLDPSRLKASCELWLATLTIYTRRYASLLIIRIFF